MSIANIGSYYSNLIEPRQLQSVLVQPNPLPTAAPATNIPVNFAGIFGAGSIITNVHLCGVGNGNATFMVGISGKDASLTGNLVVLGGTYGGFLPAQAGVAGLGVTLAQDSWITAVTASTLSPSASFTVTNYDLLVSYLS